MSETVYFQKLNFDGEPYLLCRLNDELMREGAFFVGQGGWTPYEFYLDLFDGDFVGLTLEEAQSWLPAAFLTQP